MAGSQWVTRPILRPLPARGDKWGNLPMVSGRGRTNRPDARGPPGYRAGLDRAGRAAQAEPGEQGDDHPARHHIGPDGAAESLAQG